MAAPSLIYKSGARAAVPAVISLVKQCGCHKKLRVNRTFVPVKAVYFLLWSGMVSLLPFLPVYLSYVGLNPLQVGVVKGLEPFVGLFASPIGGSLADKYSKHRLILLCSIIGTGLVYGSGVFVPLLNHGNSTVPWSNITNNIGMEWIPPHTTKNGDSHGEFTLTTHAVCAILNNNDSHQQVCLLSCKACDESPSLATQSLLSYTGCKSLTRKQQAGLIRNSSNTTCCYVDEVALCPRDEQQFSATLASKGLCLHIDTIPSLPALCNNHSLAHKFFTLQITRQQMPLKTTSEKTPTPVTTPQPPSGVSSDKNVQTFAIMLAIIVIGQFISNPSFPLLDAATMAMIKEANDKGEQVEYGHQRLWGGVAWGVFAPLSGVMIDAYASVYPDSFNRYLPAFIVFVVVVLLTVIPAMRMKFPDHRPPESLTRNLGSLLRKAKVLVFLYVMFISGVCVGVISTYQFLFLAELSGTHTVMGLTLTFTCMSEVPFMFFARQIIEKLSHRGVFVLTLFCYVIRFVAYSFLQNPWLILPVELLHGITYGALWPACTSYIALITPHNTRTTMQSVAYGIKCGLGEGLGSLVGGVVYHLFGARNLFRGCAVLCAATALFYWPTSIYLDWRDSRRGNIQYAVM
ncbi:major facilitator superfamily domain-containing protein 6-like [Diadema antillarum]|uniref:major facilitator superfamily domain-containing protein 6-like n=1 Tax=Diadema antillarum TaxID=105358 RepID=UPI003A8676AC